MSKKRWVENKLEEAVFNIAALSDYYQHTHQKEMAIVMNILTDLATDEHQISSRLKQ